MSELAATQDKPEARGFKLARKVGANATRGVSPSVAARTRVSAGGAPVRVPFVSNPGRNRTISATAPRAGVGRADLRVTFVTGSAELTEAGRREAEKFMSALNAPALAGKRFRIEGHTDSVGSRQANVDLSERRARAVVLHLTAKGADPSRFEVVGSGSDKPIVGFDASASANRRVEIVLVK